MENGTTLEIETEIKSEDIPVAVPKAVEAKFLKAAVKEVMEVNLVTGKNEKPDHDEVALAS